MPDEDGYSLIRRVRALPSAAEAATPAIALTAYARDDDVQRALRAGFNLHLPKPVEGRLLIETVLSLVKIGERVHSRA